MGRGRPLREEGRRAFLDRRRSINVTRMDTLFAPSYDEHWGHIDATHRDQVDRLLAQVPSGGLVLDAACGTGKYWPQILAAGHQLVGVDHSGEMLRRARAKHPQIETRRLALQELGHADDLAGRFEGLLCVDAMENVGPEDWPIVLAGFGWVLAPGAPAYLSVELPGPAEASLMAMDDDELVPGELFSGGGYHYYPSPGLVAGWVRDAGFTDLETAAGDGYHHVLMRRRTGVSASPRDVPPARR